jgi:hypothetical protein
VVAIALAVRGQRLARVIERRVLTKVGGTAVAVLALGLLFIHVAWPLVALLAALAEEAL